MLTLTLFPMLAATPAIANVAASYVEINPSAGAFDGAFAPGRHTVTVNGITATATAFAGNQITVTLNIPDLPAAQAALNSLAANTEANSATYMFYARGTSGATVGRAAVVTDAGADAYSGGANATSIGNVGPISDIIHRGNRAAGGGTSANNAALANGQTFTLTVPANTTDIRLYIGIRSPRLHARTAMSTAAAGVGTLTARQNLFAMNGITMNAVEHLRLSPHISSLSFRFDGTATASGGYLAWFGPDNLGPTAQPATNSTTTTNGRPASIIPQTLQTFNFSQGDPALINHTWSTQTNFPGATVVYAEFTPPSPLGSTITANNIAANSSGILFAGVAPVFQVSVNLTWDGIQAPGNHRVSLSRIPAGYQIAPGGGTEHVFRVPGTVLPRTARFNIIRTGGGEINAADLINPSTGIAVAHNFYPNGTIGNANAAGERNGLNLHGTASLNPSANLITISYTVLGVPSQTGNQTIAVTGANLPPALAHDVRGFSVRAGTPVDRVFTWQLDHNAAQPPLGFGLAVPQFGAAFNLTTDTQPLTSETGHGLIADGEFRGLADNSGIATITLTGGATAAGSYIIDLVRGATPVSDARTFRLTVGTLPSPSTISLPVEPGAGLPAIRIRFYPDITATPVQGLHASGSVSSFADGIFVDVNLTTPGGFVTSTGHFTISVLGPDGSILGSSDTLFYNEGRFVRDGVTIALPTGTAIAAPPTPGLLITFISETNFVYDIDYFDETVHFGDQVDFGNDIVYFILRNSAAVPRFEQNPARARWISTFNGHVDISRRIPRRAGQDLLIALRFTGSTAGFAEVDGILRHPEGYFDVCPASGLMSNFAFDPATGQFNGNYIIIKPRPVAEFQAIRQMGRTFYNTTEQAFINTSDHTVEFMSSFDRRRRVGFVANRDERAISAQLRAGEKFLFDIDRLPNGAQGVLRIASNEFASRALNAGGTEFELRPAAELRAAFEAATFASRPARFRVGAPPRAPRTDRLFVNPGRASRGNAPIPFIAGINQNWGIVSGRTTTQYMGNEGTNTIWHNGAVNVRPTESLFTRNMPVTAFDEALRGGFGTRSVVPVYVNAEGQYLTGVGAANPLALGTVVADRAEATVAGSAITVADITHKCAPGHAVGRGRTATVCTGNLCYEFEVRVLPQPPRRTMSQSAPMRLNALAYDLAVGTVVLWVPQTP